MTAASVIRHAVIVFALKVDWPKLLPWLTSCSSKPAQHEEHDCGAVCAQALLSNTACTEFEHELQWKAAKGMTVIVDLSRILGRRY